MNSATGEQEEKKKAQQVYIRMKDAKNPIEMKSRIKSGSKEWIEQVKLTKLVIDMIMGVQFIHLINVLSNSHSKLKCSRRLTSEEERKKYNNGKYNITGEREWVSICQVNLKTCNICK